MSEFKENESKDYKIVLTENMLGTIPKDKKIYETYIESLKPIEITESESITVEEIEEKGWTGFHTDEGGLFLFDYLCKGFLKHAGHVLRDVVGIKQLKSKLTDFVFIEPRKVYLGKQEPDGVFERPLRAQTPQGERVCLARSDYVSAGLEISFKITMIPHKEITWKVIDRLMKHGELMGLGQFRNGSFGRFRVIE
jgi:hypothetical protein